jgi:N-acetylglucosamine-6-sulfatase
MPKTKRLIGNKGVTFDNAYFSEPMCCPSRASMFRGQYPHNTHVTQNTYPDGSFKKYWEQGLARDTYATRLHDAGYRTFYAGKVMNGYGQKTEGKRLRPVLPGFSVFRGAIGDPEDNTFKFEDGSVKSFPETEQHTRGADKNAIYGLHDKIVTDWAQDFVERSKGNDKPFALVLSLHSPHFPASYPDSYQDRFVTAGLPRSPGYNEADVSDKPRFLREPKITSQEKEDLISYQRKRLRSAAFADNQIGQLVSTLKQTGQFHNTVFVFWSDNGYHMGQHRQIGINTEGNEKGDVGSKGLPYLEDVRFPMLVSGPGIPAGARSHKFISAVDLLPTLLDVAGAHVPNYADGRSFLPLARGKDIAWRDFAYSEMSNAAGTPERNWRAVYTQKEAYHEWTATGDKELYDLSRDPYELHNLLSPGDSAASLGTLVKKMATCSRDACRRAENP